MHRGVAVLLVSILISAGLIHAAIPHSHGETHHHEQTEETPVWTSLHSAVLHEQKKMPLVAVFVSVLIAAVLLMVLPRPVCAPALARARDRRLGEHLRRGTHPYRKFG